MADRRESGLQRPYLTDCPQVAIVAYRVPAFCQRIGEAVQMHRAPVFFLPHPGMDGETGDRVAVEKLQQSGKFLQRVIAQPSFDGYRQRGAGKHHIKKARQLIGVSQKARALALGGNGAGGAA